MNVGDRVLISPDLTHRPTWAQATVIEVEENSFVGLVISAKTDDGTIYFGYSDLFKPNAEATCTH